MVQLTECYKLFVGGSRSGAAVRCQVITIDDLPQVMASNRYVRLEVIQLQDLYVAVYAHCDPIDVVRRSVLMLAADLAWEIKECGDMAVGRERFIRKHEVVHLNVVEQSIVSIPFLKCVERQYNASALQRRLREKAK